MGKTRIIEFKQPPPLYGTPKFGLIFVKRCLIGLVYGKLHIAVWQSLLLLGKNHGGLQHPPSEDED